ncbi:hypothetical protein HPC49_49315, partial [Pyxidicoccus fallax]
PAKAAEDDDLSRTQVNQVIPPAATAPAKAAPAKAAAKPAAAKKAAAPAPAGLGEESEPTDRTVMVQIPTEVAKEDADWLSMVDDLDK